MKKLNRKMKKENIKKMIKKPFSNVLEKQCT